MGKLPVSLAVPEENLSFPAPGGNKTSVLAQGSAEVPVEFDYSGVAMRLDCNSLDFEFAGGEQAAHELHADVGLDLFPTLFVAEGVDERNVVTFGRQRRVCSVNRGEVPVNYGADGRGLIGGPGLWAAGREKQQTKRGCEAQRHAHYPFA